jgi:hypothetical protein
MAYLHSQSQGEAARQQAREESPFGPGFPETVASSTEKLEVWASSFKDGGGDYCEFRAFDAQGRSLGTRRINGY